jgi:hypothetical protein
MDITQELIKELFHYEDGKLFNKTKRSRKIRIGDEAGSLQADGYRRIRINGKRYMTHRMIYMFHSGEITDNLHIDHVDKDKSNNNIENLRLVTKQENGFNTDAKGYTLHKPSNKFMAQIKLNGKQINLGYFDTAEEARAAYLEAKERLHIIQERI